MALHASLTAAADLHRIGVIASADPGAIGAGKVWIDSDDNAVRIRNAADSGWIGPLGTGSGDALVANPLSQFAATTSAQLAGVLSDETGSGAAVFASAPTLVNPVVGTQTPLDNSTKAASTAYVEAAVAAGGGYTDEQAQDAVGAMVDATLVYVDATPLLTRAALTGDVTAAQASNATTIANDAVTFAKMQNINTDRLIGRETASSGDPEEIALGNSVVLLSTTLHALQWFTVAVSDETTALTTGDGKVTFRMPFAMTLTAVRASVVTAPTGAGITIDITEGGTTVFSTLLTIDATEKTSVTAATPAVISDSALADDAEIAINIDAVGSTIAGAGLKVTFYGRWV